jgi:anti-sigma factor RsiW
VNPHLKREQFNNLVLGVADGESVAHVAACPQCEAEVETFRQTLAAFRGAAIDWSVDAARGMAPPRKQRTRLVLVRPAWALAFTAAVLGFVLPLSVWTTHNRRSFSEAQTQIARDNQLLAHIDSEIGETTPMPMQPLQVNTR